MAAGTIKARTLLDGAMLPSLPCRRSYGTVASSAGGQRLQGISRQLAALMGPPQAAPAPALAARQQLKQRQQPLSYPLAASALMSLRTPMASYSRLAVTFLRCALR